MASWQTIPVFISSTFVDMQAERDVLVKRVFPSLRARLEPYRIRIVEIDLRWGITSEQERSGRVLDLCFQMIDKSRPYFIGLLGERYGSVPRHVTPDLLQRHAWLPQSGSMRTSVTELEVLYGVLNHPTQSGQALFYLRDPGPLHQVPAALHGFLTDQSNGNVAIRTADSLSLENITQRLHQLGVADARSILEQWIEGHWPPEHIDEMLTDRERLDLLKMRLRKAGLVQADGYSWDFEGIRVRWNLARLAFPNDELVTRLQALAPQGVVSPNSFLQLTQEPQILGFLREYGTVALRGLERFAKQVESDLWKCLNRDNRVLDSIRRRGTTIRAGAPKEAIQDRRFFSWLLSFSRGNIPLELKLLPPEIASQLLEQLIGRNPAAIGLLKPAAELWYDRRDSTATEVGGLAEDWADERDQHTRYAESRLALYVRRRDVERVIKKHLVAATGRMLVITGAPGAGKSAILSKTDFFCRALIRRKQGVVASHFIGATAASGSLDRLLKRLSIELSLFDASEIDDLAQDTDNFAERFVQALQEVDAKKPCYIVLDALDQLDPVHRAHELHWLPTALPPHVQLVVSFANDPESSLTNQLVAALRVRDCEWLDVDQQEYRLTDRHRREIIERVPSLVAKSLEPDHVSALLEIEATRNPLYLKVALEELRSFGTFRLLSARINEFKKASTPEQLFAQVIDELKLDFDAHVVQCVLAALAASRHGMSETELAELVASASEELDSSQQQQQRDEVAALLRHLQPYLHWRGTLLDFLHRSLQRAVERTLLREPSIVRDVHRALGNYFEKLGRNAVPPWSDAGKRSIAESLHHFVKAEEWDPVIRLLNDDIFILRKGRSPYHADLAHEWSVTLARAPADYATAAAISFARGGSQQFALSDVVASVVLQAARADEQRFISLRHSLQNKGALWRGELLKAQALLIGIGLKSSAETVISLVESSYDGDEKPDDGIAASYQQRAVLSNSAGNFAEGLAFAERSAELGRAANDKIRVAIADSTKVASLDGLTRHEEAAQLTRELFNQGRGTPGINRVLPRAIMSGFNSLVKIGEVEEAEKLLREGLNECGRHKGADYDYASLAIHLGNHSIQQQKPAEAIPVLRTALGMPAHSYPEELRPHLYYLLFLCHANLNRVKEAQLVFEVAANYRWSPKGRQVFEQVFQLVLNQAAGHANTSQLNHFYNLAIQHEQKGEIELAEAAYKRCLTFDSNNVIVLGNYAFFLQNSHRKFDQAREVYRRALELDDNDFVNHTNFAGLYLTFGQYEDAEHHLQTALARIDGKKDRYTARAYFLLAALAALRGQPPDTYLGQVKSLFEAGIEPAASRNVTVMEYLERHLAAATFSLFAAVFQAINTREGRQELTVREDWTVLQPVALPLPRNQPPT